MTSGVPGRSIDALRAADASRRFDEALARSPRDSELHHCQTWDKTTLAGPWLRRRLRRHRVHERATSASGAGWIEAAASKPAAPDLMAGARGSGSREVDWAMTPVRRVSRWHRQRSVARPRRCRRSGSCRPGWSHRSSGHRRFETPRPVSRSPWTSRFRCWPLGFCTPTCRCRWGRG